MFSEQRSNLFILINLKFYKPFLLQMNLDYSFNLKLQKIKPRIIFLLDKHIIL
jgi:hypothetical protein